MDTKDLITALTADVRRPATQLAVAWWIAVGVASVLAATLVLGMLGPRPDIAAFETPRVLFKFAFAIVLAVSAFGVVRTLSRPDGEWHNAAPFLVAAPVLLVVAVIAELLVMPPETWTIRMMGTTKFACVRIMLIGLGPLAVFLAALQYGAPTRPAIAGAIAGLLAGGVTATFYAVYCTNDSPLFIAVWYTIAIAGLALIGAVGGHRVAQW